MRSTSGGNRKHAPLDSARLEMRLVEAQLQALQRQLHPHFLFNTLNAIAGLMRTDVDAADRMMDRLGDLLRMTLHTSNVQEVPLKEELEMLQKYLDIEQVRLGDRLIVSMVIDPEVLDAQVPNFLLQPLVENAVRHGIAPHARPGSRGSAVRDGARLAIRIGDSGDGVAPHRLTLLNQGVGLANTRARLEHLYRGDHSLIFSNVNGGFRVSLSIPFSVTGRAARVAQGRQMPGRSSMTKIRDAGRGRRANGAGARCSCARARAGHRGGGRVRRSGGRRSRPSRDAPGLVVPRHADAGIDGLESRADRQPSGMPAVVFVTAHDEYALRAFEVRALDYLLKPFSAERFRTALGHAREHVSQRRKVEHCGVVIDT